jgi:uncharacterized protein
MEDDIQIHMYEEVDLKNSLLIDGFPTVGLLSTIVSSFIVDALKLRRVGSVVSRHFPAAAIIQNGVPSPPLRIYAGPKLCGPNDECDQVVVLNSEVRIPDSLQLPLAEKILQWARNEEVNLVLTVEGTPLQDAPDPDDNMGIYGAGSTDRTRELITQYNLMPMDMGIITGVSGNMLFLGDMGKQDVLCLLGPAHAQYPDARAAAKMIEVIDDMLPVIEIDTAPLLDQASKIEKDIQGALDMIQRGLEHGKEPQPLPGPMYR